MIIDPWHNDKWKVFLSSLRRVFWQWKWFSTVLDSVQTSSPYLYSLYFTKIFAFKVRFLCHFY